eukprot:s320_g11.t2
MLSGYLTEPWKMSQRGALQAIAGHAQARRADLLSSNRVPSDGSRCEGCGEYFGILRRRQICGSCDRYFCASCLGAFTVAGIGCFCGSRCAECRELGQKSGEFETIRTKMEDGVSVTISFPPKASMFGSSGRRKVAAWLSLKTDLVWATLEQRAGQPLEQGQLPLAEVLHVRNTGVQLELSVKGQSQPTHLEFGTAEERINWERYLNLAAEVLVPESERAERETAKAAFRAQEIEERRALNEVNLALFRKMIGAPTADVEAQRLLDERRRISLQEIAHVWCYVLDLFIFALFLVQLCGVLDPMVRFLPFFFGVATGSEILRRLADDKDSVTPSRLDRDATLLSILVFISTLGMPREFMPACYMARTLCFSFTCSRFGNKVNLALAPFYVLAHWLTQSPEGPPERLEFHIFSEMIAVSFMTLLMTTLDTKEHKLAQASVELEAKAKELKEAEREGSAAQRLLSVTCDASVRLSHNLAIQTASHSLLDLLMCHFGNKSATSLDGTPFVKYIAPVDHQRFTDFIAESSSALTPARSLHIKMKDSSGVSFDAELFHVTVPGFTDKPEHLIGITNDSNSADRVGRMENLCPSSDMRHVLGFGVANSAQCQSNLSKKSKSMMSPSLQSPSQAGSSDSGSCASRESRSPSRYKELKCLKNISMIVDADVENDFMIRQLTFNFPSCRSCSHEVLPNLLEWLKPHYQQRVSDIIEQKMHATHAEVQREEERKKNLSQGLGMRYTAEAMMARSSTGA